MAKVKTGELTGPALDWAVGVAEGRQPGAYKGVVRATAHPDCPDSAPMFGPELNYSTDWAQAGPIIQREGISTRLNHKQAQLWEAYIWLPTQHDQSEADSNSYTAFGTTPLIAAMRCFCCSKLGDTVEVPDELL